MRGLHGLEDDFSDAQDGSPRDHEYTEPTQPLHADDQLTIHPSERTLDPGKTGLAPRIVLELHDEPPDEPDEPPTVIDLASPRQQGNASMAPLVLLVEDTDDYAVMVRETLRRIPVDILHARNGRQAGEMLSENNPDVIVLDIGLPDMTGWNILDLFKERFEQMPPEQRPRVVVLTAYSDAANRLIGKFQHIFRFMVKTATPSELQAAVREAIDHRP